MVDGFSSADPRLARGPQVAAQPRRKTSGTGRRKTSGTGRRKTSGTGRRRVVDRQVDVRGDVVFIDGQGFSVAPAEQERFIRQQTGGTGSSAQAAIEQARTNLQEEQAQRKAEALELSQRQKEKQRDIRLREEQEARREDFLETPEVTLVQRDDQRFRTGFGEAALGFVGAVGRNIGEIITGIGLGRDIDLEDPFKSFEFAGKTEGEREIITPQFGTITDATSPTSGFDVRTARDVREEAEIISGIPLEVVGASPGGQLAFIREQERQKAIERVTPAFQRGLLTEEEAVQEAQRSFEEGFTGRAGAVIDIEERFGDLSVTTGQKFAEFAPRALTSAAIIGGTLASPVVAAGVGAAFLAGAGQLSVQAGREFGDFFDFSPKARTEKLTGLKTLGKAAIFGFSGASLVSGALGPQGTIPREITQIRVEELGRQRFTFGGEEVLKTPKGDVLVRLTGTRATPTAAQEVDLIVPVFQTGFTPSGAAKFSITGGRGVSVTRVQQFGLQGLVREGDDILRSFEKFSFTARGKAGLEAGILRPEGFKVILPEDISASFGRLDLVRDGGVIRTTFGGITREADDVFQVIGGRLKTARVDITETAVRPSVRFAPEGVGEIKKFTGVAASPIDDTLLLDLGKFDISPPALAGRVGAVQAPVVSDLTGAGLQAGFKAIDIIKPTTIAPVAPSIGGAAAALDIKVDTKTFQAPKLDPAITTKVTQDKFSIVSPVSRQSLESQTIKKVKTGQRGLTSLDFAPALQTITEQDVGLKLRTKQQQKLVEQFAPPTFAFAAPSIRPGDFKFDFRGGLVPPIGLPGGLITDTPGARVVGTRLLERTPSLGAVLKMDLGLKQPKLGRGLEETGLFERAFEMPQLIEPMGMTL